MQHAADFRKCTIRVNDRTYEFSNLENTRTADRALAYLLKIKQQEMLAPMDFSLNNPAIVPVIIEYGDVSTGDYRNIRTYYHKGED